jgi:hypothetical protein
MDLRQASVKAPFGMSGRVTDPLHLEPLPILLQLKILYLSLSSVR